MASATFVATTPVAAVAAAPRASPATVLAAARASPATVIAAPTGCSNRLVALLATPFAASAALLHRPFLVMSCLTGLPTRFLMHDQCQVSTRCSGQTRELSEQVEHGSTGKMELRASARLNRRNE